MARGAAAIASRVWPPEGGRHGNVAVVGGGPAGLMAAETAVAAGARVTVYDAMPSVGRKFLLAGRGGLNLTHSEPFDAFLARYGPAAQHLEAALDAFPPSALRAWAAGLGQETVVGSSGRVFPRVWKASPLLRTWLRRLEVQGVALATRHRWTGWDGDRLAFDAPNGPVTMKADAVVLALGGASWPRLGSDGAWTALLAEAGIAISPLQPSNVAVCVPWSDHVRERFEGEPLKRIAATIGGETRRGEAVVTRSGLEGGVIYALSRPIRAALAKHGEATLLLDLRPDLDEAALSMALARARPGQSLATTLRKTGFAPSASALLREACGPSSPPDAPALAHALKALPIRITGTGGPDRAISTAGGVSFQALTDDMMLRAHPGSFVAGEMLDWDAPTGGYLLQAAFATGALAGRAAARWAAGRPDR